MPSKSLCAALVPVALDRFLAYVDSKQTEGRVVYVTAGEAADLSFP